MEAKEMTYRLGNMTLLSTAQNAQVGNSEYAIKSTIFKTSGFSITKKIANECDDWTPQTINSQQSYLARIASGIWRIPELS